MNGYVEAGYIVVAGVLGGYAALLARKSRRTVTVPVEENGDAQGRGNNGER